MAEPRVGETQVGYLLEGPRTYEAPRLAVRQSSQRQDVEKLAHIAVSAAHGQVAEKTGRQNARTGLRFVLDGLFIFVLFFMFTACHQNSHGCDVFHSHVSLTRATVIQFCGPHECPRDLDDPITHESKRNQRVKTDTVLLRMIIPDS
ncbi:hypothetical protein G5I_12618 [Acromyrmex echinatior]|uniref:Uncharacterized protein n=1 Tax=Acromyrmex echinatior TaxID=103372 RepID=F4X2T7_ACREC|nr:hypothetical protein G5I_12618 [Acromyrmex echinatior]